MVSQLSLVSFAILETYDGLFLNGNTEHKTTRIIFSIASISIPVKVREGRGCDESSEAQMKKTKKQKKNKT